MPLSLYIHIPFCASACPYCDFAFVVRKTHLAGAYVDAVAAEIGRRLQDRPEALVDTIFGGGTPSQVAPEQLERLFDAIRAHAPIDPEAEITAEANPNDHDAFRELRELGVNRLSIGAQALHDNALHALGRVHSVDDVQTAVNAARDAGFNNVNLDLIFGAPGQSPGDWAATLDRAIDLRPNHLSVYGLTIEPGTNFWKRREKGRLVLPEDDDQAVMYNHALERLEAAGFEQYEVSNFARPEMACRHNLLCWERNPYLGVGLSAHSFLDGVRSWNTRDLDDYLGRVESGRSPVEGSERLTAEDIRLERILLDLRRPCGVSASDVSTSAAERFLADGLLERSGARLKLSRRGLLLADWISSELAEADQPSEGSLGAVTVKEVA